MKGLKKTKKGFTLIELLIVIAIIAILSVVVILTLNPAELLRESRDSNRVSDLSVTKSAISFYLTSGPSPLGLGTSGVCYIGDAVGTSSCSSWFQTDTSVATSVTRSPTTSGWIPINFTGITAGGSPLSQLPVDPLFGSNDGVHFYSYTASSTGLVFKLGAVLESTKYASYAVNDGGISSSTYEVGTNLQL